MRIGIITYFADEEFGGVKVLIEQLVHNLLKIDKKNEYFLIHGKKTNNPIYKLDVTEIIVPAKSKFKRLFLALFHMNKIVKKYRLDVVHEIAFYYPRISKGKLVVTVNDVEPYLYPETHTTMQRMNDFLRKHLMMNAHHVIAISKRTKEDLIQLFNMPSARISAVYCGLDNSLFKKLNKKACTEFILKKYSIQNKFILNVGTLQPRKNVLALLRAFKMIKSDFPDFKLVIVGKKGWKYKEIFDAVDKLSLKSDVVFVGYVSDDDLPKFYNAAELFVHPSLYEGFGFPPLEAMGCGCPVVTSNTGSTPEIVGNPELMVDPQDVEGLSKIMRRILMNEKLKRSIVNEGLLRAKRFDWKRTAQETLQVYEKVFKENNNSAGFKNGKSRVK